MSFFQWLREGVRQAVVLGLADAVEDVGTRASSEDLGPALAQSLLELIKALPGEGRTVIFVEHNMDVVQEISDWVVVMAEGRIIAQGTPAEIKSNKAVVDAYLGAHHGEDLSKVELS